MMNLVNNKIQYGKDTQARFDYILGVLDCHYAMTREEKGFDTLKVLYVMHNAQIYCYTEDLYGTPISIERLR